MRRKSAGKKLMAVLIAASLALTPVELTVAAEMETEGAEATFLAEESGDTASSDPEDTAETETEITDGSAATEEQETTDTDKPDTGNNVQENAETGAMESGEEAPEGTAEEEDPETPEAVSYTHLDVYKRQEFDQAFSKYDVLLAPASPFTAPKLGESLKDPLAMYLGDIYTVAVNLCGLPGITVPCGKDAAGLPIGIQMIGDCFKENNLFRAAHAYEKKRGDFGTAMEGGEKA